MAYVLFDNLIDFMRTLYSRLHITLLMMQELRKKLFERLFGQVYGMHIDFPNNYLQNNYQFWSTVSFTEIKISIYASSTLEARDYF